MKSPKKQTLDEFIRTKLNSVAEKDSNGNYNRLAWQIFTLIASDGAKNSPNPNVRNVGKLVRKGTEESIADYVSEKVRNFVLKSFRNDPYSL